MSEPMNQPEKFPRLAHLDCDVDLKDAEFVPTIGAHRPIELTAHGKLLIVSEAHGHMGENLHEVLRLTNDVETIDMVLKVLNVFVDKGITLPMQEQLRDELRAHRLDMEPQ